MNTALIGRRGYLSLGMLAFSAGLVLCAPAPLVNHWLKPKDAPAAFELTGVEGTVLKGSAGGVQVNGRPALDALEWQLKPLWLLLANVSADLRAEADQTMIETGLSLWPGSRVNAKHLNYSGSVKALLAAAGQPYLPLDGMVRIVDGRVKLKNAWPHSAKGTLQLQGLAWTLAASPITLGDFEAQLSNADDAIIAQIASTGGPLELKGEAQVRPDRSYQLDLAYRPKPEATPVLRNLLASNGAPDASGWYRIKRQQQAPPAAP